MRIRLLALLSAVALAMGIGGAFAEPNPGPGGSQEGEEVCDENGENCTDVYDNQVECGDNATVAEEGSLSVHANQDGTGGFLEVCNDGDTVPVQGRIIAQGDAAAQDGSICADGDADNEGEAQGWACVQGDGDGTPTVVCGDDNGNLDSQNQTAEDGQEDCGSDPPAPPA